MSYVVNNSKFYEQLFAQKCFSKFCVLQIGFVIFWQKEIGATAARNFLVKLTEGSTINMYILQVKAIFSNLKINS